MSKNKPFIFPTVIACALLSLLTASTVYATTYNVAADWSLFSNPNGVWSYNVGSTALNSTQLNWGTVTGETFWATAGSTLPPAWTKAVTTGPTKGVGDTGDWLPGDVIGHASGQSNTNLANITWTSPINGQIDITGKAWDAYHCCSRNDEWQLSFNGTIIAQRLGTGLTGGILGITRSDTAALFANNLVIGQSLTNIAVKPGDVVMFELQTLTVNGHFTGLDLTINAYEADGRGGGDPVPEPTSVLLLGTGLGFLGLAGWRRKKVRIEAHPK
jgi:hypothetical protein